MGHVSSISFTHGDDIWLGNGLPMANSLYNQFISFWTLEVSRTLNLYCGGNSQYPLKSELLYGYYIRIRFSLKLDYRKDDGLVMLHANFFLHQRMLITFSSTATLLSTFGFTCKGQCQEFSHSWQSLDDVLFLLYLFLNSGKLHFS